MLRFQGERANFKLKDSFPNELSYLEIGTFWVKILYSQLSILLFKEHFLLENDTHLLETSIFVKGTLLFYYDKVINKV